MARVVSYQCGRMCGFLHEGLLGAENRGSVVHH